MPKCKKHNEEKRIVGVFQHKYTYTCKSCISEQLNGLNEDFKKLQDNKPMQDIKS